MTNEEFKRLAEQLEASPDYRVLRRLDPASLYRPDAAIPPGAIRGVVVDVEATGLDVKVDQVVELGIVPFILEASGRLVTALPGLSELRDPGMPISEEAERVNHISNEMVAGKQIDPQVVSELIAGAAVVIAHSAGFDRPLCEKHWPAFAELPWTCSLTGVPWRERGASGRALANLAADAGFFFSAHRAELDCLALLRILDWQGSDSTAPTAMQHLLQNLGGESRHLYAVNAPFAAKDLLKSRGYQWKGETDAAGEKSWHIEVPLAELQVEATWLREVIYGNRSVPLPMDKIDALNRFSGRRIPMHRLDI